jgi:hypothetical protein
VGNVFYYEQTLMTKQLNVHQTYHTVWLTALYGTLAALEYMAYTYMAFRFLEAGVEVHYYQKESKCKAILTVVILKWLWLAFQLTGQFMAQWFFAHYLVARNV